jgi:TDG/mug DNA glycosylase family protein
MRLAGSSTTATHINKMQQEYGFPPIIGNNPEILILGSMPGVKSLDEQQYYAHPRNAFWPIMASLFDFDLNLDYQQRCQALSGHKVAVWDVLKSCQRQGSLDSAIEKDSIEVNNFKQLLSDYPSIKTIYFNGGAAEQLFKKHVLKSQQISLSKITMIKLPSTSPAHAAMSLEQKKKFWQDQIVLR